MPSQGFTDELKHMVRDTTTGARERLGALQRGLHSGLGRVRALPSATKMKIGVCVACVVVFAGGLALRGEAPTTNHGPSFRLNDMGSASAAENPRPTRAAHKSYAAGKAEESQGAYKAAAQSYATAARKGDVRGFNKLVAMTHAPKCEARSEAADALGTLRSKKATATLKRLARAKFKDESKTPGIFSCSSRRAAQKALEQHGRG
jgi:hypothetical protein